jgi:hypothetical protein
LIALSSEPRKSKEAAFKYFVLGSFASALMLYGISFIYGTVGSTYIQDITQVSNSADEYQQAFSVWCRTDDPRFVFQGLGVSVSLMDPRRLSRFTNPTHSFYEHGRESGFIGLLSALYSYGGNCI